MGKTEIENGEMLGFHLTFKVKVKINDKRTKSVTFYIEQIEYLRIKLSSNEKLHENYNTFYRKTVSNIVKIKPKNA